MSIRDWLRPRTTMSIPVLNWDINGDTLIAWINDDEFYDIRPDAVGDFRLSINSLSNVYTEFLGAYNSYVDAQYGASDHVGDA